MPWLILLGISPKIIVHEVCGWCHAMTPLDASKCFQINTSMAASCQKCQLLTKFGVFSSKCVLSVKLKFVFPHLSGEGC